MADWPADQSEAPQYRGLNSGRELPEETNIIFKQQADISDFIEAECLAFYTHTEGETAVFGRIYAAHFENGGVHHTAAQNFEPSGPLGEAIILLCIRSKPYIHFGGGFGEREK